LIHLKVLLGDTNILNQRFGDPFWSTIMASLRQRKAARKNIRKAQARWRAMTKRQHSLAQPEGRARRRPGTGGKGRYYRIEVRPTAHFISYRLHDVGRGGHTKRLAGKRTSGSWDTKSWLVLKSDARVKGRTLVIESPSAKTALKGIRGPIRHFKGDIFRAKPRRNIPEASKPTAAQRRARAKNIKKAQRARWRRR
jgi:hypothetical protein